VKIGIISDTHGIVHPQAFRVFEGVDHILHTGDIGTDDVLIELAALAPVTAIHGNADPYELQVRYPAEQAMCLGGVTFLLRHQALAGQTPLKEAMESALRVGAEVLVFGHSHIPFCRVMNEILFFNPGGGGKKRFSLPRSVGLMEVSSEIACVTLTPLDGSGSVERERPKVWSFRLGPQPSEHASREARGR
jgi:hypothetical protein